MTFIKLTAAAAVAALAVTSGGVAMADGPAIKPISKSTQAVPVPPTPPWVTAIFGPNATLALGGIGTPGVVATVLIGGTAFLVIINNSDSSTTT